MVERVTHRLTHSLLLWDVLITLACLQASSAARRTIELGKTVPVENIYWPTDIYLAVIFIWASVFLLLTPHRAIFHEPLMAAMGRLAVSIGLAALTFAGLLYLTYRDVSRLQFVYFAGGTFLALTLFHLAVYAYYRFRRRHPWQRRLLIVGDGPVLRHVATSLSRQPLFGLTVVGYVADQAELDESFEKLGTIDRTTAVVSEHQIDEVIFALPPEQQSRIVGLSLAMHDLPVMLHMTTTLLDLSFSRTPVTSFGGVPLVSLRESALSETQSLLKRLFDIVLSLLLLIALAPIWLLLALLIKLETRGPIFFRQTRIGQHGKRFTMLKFRSMYADAEQRWQEVSRRDEQGRLIHKQDDDPRITPLGRYLRRTSLDELPQLLNVLLGEMSLVGPRPEMPYIAAEYEPWQWQRFRVPPGMTGWWQINGRSDKPMHLHTEYDLYYIQNYSFWLDLRILARTVSVLLHRGGAY
jgi:exopolysaccharide biosynthesis polyprenyl glycosylphosphotransferase